MSCSARMNDGSPHLVVLCDRYPELSETFIAGEVRALRRAGAEVTVEALAEAAHPARGAKGPNHVWELEPTRRRIRSMAWLAARHPLRCARDLLERRRWRREEPVVPLRMLAPAARRIAMRGRPVHIHAHFAVGAALASMRIGAVLDVPYSVVAHGYDIYQRPANLAEKLARAAFAAGTCDYTVRDLGARAHRIVMGVDGARFARSSPPVSERSVVAVGRLVEKKGFADLIDAVALMRRPPERVTIAGEGPLRDSLAAQIEAAGLSGVVHLAGALEHDRVRELIEHAAVLCMPCVIAADGDRDSMPVVVKEALALEVPVVATDEVGLPEVVRPQWGALVPPRDPAALAAALDAELDRSPADRAARGRAGRAFVLAECDVDAEAARLLELVRSCARERPRGARRSRGGSAS